MSANNNTTHNDCPDLTPSDECDLSCCPDYEADSDWCKAFNKRTLEQRRQNVTSMIDGMWFNIEDAKNTIGQAEQYLAIIYELLLASTDQVISISSHSSATVGDIEAANTKIKEFMKEIDNVVRGSQYNGRRLLAEIQADHNADADYVDAFEAATTDNAIVFRLSGARGVVRTLGVEHNDFTYNAPEVGVNALGVSGLTLNGLGTEADVSANATDLIDPAITALNSAAMKVGVALDTMKAYRYILCLREKQVRIFKNGQDICFDHKCKI